jgi:hypothetical protein
VIGGFHFRSKHDSFKLPPLRMSQSIGCNARFADASVVVAILKIGHRGQHKVWPIESRVNDLVQNTTFPPDHDDRVSLVYLLYERIGSVYRPVSVLARDGVTPLSVANLARQIDVILSYAAHFGVP